MIDIVRFGLSIVMVVVAFWLHRIARDLHDDVRRWNYEDRARAQRHR